jgi:DNA-binding transcriptional ArsR family regulator
MPERLIVAKELAGLLGVLSHPHRIRIVAELREGEMDVNSLQKELGISHSGVSQHLSLLRAHRLVEERREGRHVFYHLRQPELAEWLFAGLAFFEGEWALSDQLRTAVEHVRTVWGEQGPAPTTEEKATSSK